MPSPDGVDAILGWGRLLAVVPKDFRELIDGAKAQVDFWVNLWFLVPLVSLLPFGLAVYSGKWTLCWLTVLALFLAWVSAYGARSAVRDWGHAVKSAFDVFRVDLCRKLGYRLPASLAEQRDFWESCTQMFLYRDPEWLRRFDYLRDLTIASTLSGFPPSPPAVK